MENDEQSASDSDRSQETGIYCCRTCYQKEEEEGEDYRSSSSNTKEEEQDQQNQESDPEFDYWTE